MALFRCGAGTPSNLTVVLPDGRASGSGTEQITGHKGAFFYSTNAERVLTVSGMTLLGTANPNTNTSFYHIDSDTASFTHNDNVNYGIFSIS